MQRLGNFQAILFILKKIELITHTENKLSSKQKKRLSDLSKKEQKHIEKKILQKKEEEKKNLLNIWATLLKEKVKGANLPPKITNQILEMANSVKNGTQATLYESDTKTAELNQAITASLEKEILPPKKETKKGDSLIDEINLTQLTHSAQARSTETKFKKATQHYFKNKLLSSLKMPQEKPNLSAKTQHKSPPKKGMMLPKVQIELEQKHKNELMDLLVQEIQKEEKENKTVEEITTAFQNMIPYQQKIALKAVKEKHPEIAQAQEMEEKAAYEAQLQKNIERQRRKKAQKEEKRTKRAARLGQQENVQMPPKTRLKEILKEGQLNSSLQRKEGLLSRLKKAKSNSYPPDLANQK